ERDARTEELRKKYAPKIAALEEKVRKAQQKVEKEKSKSRFSILQSILGFGSTVLGAVLGRKALSVTNLNKATQAAKGVGRSVRDSQSAAQAEETQEKLNADLAAMDEEFKTEVAALEAKVDPLSEKFESIVIKPKKTNITIKLVALAWSPS